MVKGQLLLACSLVTIFPSQGFIPWIAGGKKPAVTTALTRQNLFNDDLYKYGAAGKPKKTARGEAAAPSVRGKENRSKQKDPVRSGNIFLLPGLDSGRGSRVGGATSASRSKKGGQAQERTRKDTAAPSPAKFFPFGSKREFWCYTSAPAVLVIR